MSASNWLCMGWHTACFQTIVIALWYDIPLTDGYQVIMLHKGGESDIEFFFLKIIYTMLYCYLVSSSWHHAGNNKAILCADCRVHFQRYGFMRNISSKREPPDFMFKDYHLVCIRSHHPCMVSQINSDAIEQECVFWPHYMSLLFYIINNRLYNVCECFVSFS